MKNQCLYKILSLLLCFKTLLSQKLFEAGAALQGGFIIPHSRDVEYVRQSIPIGASVGLTFSSDVKKWGICNCIPTHHFGYIFFDYDNNILGKGNIVYYRLNPYFQISSRMFWGFQGAMGIALLNKPYHPLTNPNNISYSMYFNGYLGIGSVFKFIVNKKFSFVLELNYHHISNGGLKEPNKGINWPVLGLGGYYLFGKERNYYLSLKDSLNKYHPNQYIKTNNLLMNVYFSSRIIQKGDKKRWMIYGVSSEYFHNISKLSDLVIGIDYHYDDAINVISEVNKVSIKPDFFSVLVGHSLNLGHFHFSNQLGYYFIYPDLYPYKVRFYHRWTLMYQINKRVLAGISLKAHLHIAHFMDFRISYVFFSKSKIKLLE
ncbi:MAG: acyloxyacyl hydrolase [Bacteroidia bacterium]|nr:acyloxyacyl hydrolase [Bacteroidia bacterium]